MDVVSIVNGNVCGRFRDVLARKVRFLQVHNSASLVIKRVPYSSTRYYRERRIKALPPALNSIIGLIAMGGRIGRLACMLKIETTKMDPKPNFHMLSKEDYASVCF
jgi:hypothetical protein